MISCKIDMNWWEKSTNMWPLTFFHWLMTSWWRNMSDIFYILSIPEMFYYHVITLMSSLDTLVKWYNVPNFGADNCSRSPDSLLLPSGSRKSKSSIGIQMNLKFNIRKLISELPRILCWFLNLKISLHIKKRKTNYDYKLSFLKGIFI